MTVHGCEMMTGNVENTFRQHAVRADCPDCLIAFQPNAHIYRMMIHDGGSSTIAIQHCPWCGLKLPAGVDMDLEARDEEIA